MIRWSERITSSILGRTRPWPARRLVASIAATAVLAVLVASVGLAQWRTMRAESSQIERLETALWEQQATNLEHQVDVAVAAIEDVRADLAGAPEAEVQLAAKDAVRALTYGDDGYFFVYSYDGINLVTAPKPELEGQNLIDMEDAEGNRLIAALIDVAKAGGGTHEYLWDKPSTGTNEPKLSYAAGIDDWEWMVGTGVYIDSIDAQVAEVHDEVRSENVRGQLLLTGILLLIGLLSVVAALGAGDFLARPLRRLADVMRGLGGDSGDLTVRLDAEGVKETIDLADGFNSFADKTHATVVEVQQATVSLAAAAAQLDGLAASSAATVRRQAEETQSAATAFAQLSVAIGEVSDSATRVFDDARRAGETSEASHEDVNASVAAMEALDAEIAHAAGEVERLAAESQGIGGFLGEIEEVADQINLLSLNASIEAARAGEHGRGFAVVAEEVRDLAARTREITAKIEAVASELGVDAQSAVDAMGSSRDRSGQVMERSRSASVALDTIHELIDQMQGGVSSVASAVEQQSVTSSELERSFQSVSGQIGEIERSTTESSQATAELARLGAQLTELVGQFKV